MCVCVCVNPATSPWCELALQVTPSQLFAVAGRVGTGLNINTCSPVPEEGGDTVEAPHHRRRQDDALPQDEQLHHPRPRGGVLQVRAMPALVSSS